MSVERRKHPHRGWVWYSTEAQYWNEDREPVQNMENRELQKRKNFADREFEESKPTAEWKELANNQEATQGRAEFETRIISEVQKFIGTHPTYVACPENQRNIEAAIAVALEKTGRTWEEFTTSDLHRAIDAVYDSGRLITSGEFKRLTPTEAELRSMPLDELENFIRFDQHGY